VHGGEERHGMRKFGTALNGKLIGAIGDPTRKTLQDMGFDVDVMPERATFKDLLLAIKDHLDKK
jgi:uroporphyrinogen-III synthase